MNMNMATPYVIYYDVDKRGQRKMDVRFECPLCGRRSHLVISGNRKVKAASDYLHRVTDMLIQDLPFEVPVRTYLRDGFCRDCQELMLGKTNKNIKYVKEERR